jgi:hypothetical protein
LKKGCGSHNYFLFYRDAINLCLLRGDWHEAQRYAALLESYVAEQPTRWSDFQIAKARAMAAIGEGRKDGHLRKRLGGLQRQAASPRRSSTKTRCDFPCRPGVAARSRCVKSHARRPVIPR